MNFDRCLSGNTCSGNPHRLPPQLSWIQIVFWLLWEACILQMFLRSNIDTVTQGFPSLLALLGGSLILGKNIYIHHCFVCRFVSVLVIRNSTLTWFHSQCLFHTRTIMTSQLIITQYKIFFPYFTALKEYFENETVS